MRRFGVVLLVAAFLAPASSAGAAEFNNCTEKFQRISHLRRIQVSCDKARWVSQRFDEKVMDAGEWPSGDLKVHRYRCGTKETGYETYRVTCTRKSGAVVRFQWGV